MPAADLGQIIALLIAATGLFLTALQLARQRREQRMGQIILLHERLYNDDDLQQMYRRLERGERYPVYPEPGETTPHTRLEEQLDKLLGLFEVAARLRQLSLIGDDELDLIAYEYLTVHQNPGVQEYLDIVVRSNQARGMRIEPVKAFREWATRFRRATATHPCRPTGAGRRSDALPTSRGTSGLGPHRARTRPG